MIFALPPGVVEKSVTLLQGFHSGVTKIVSGKLVHTTPLFPGSPRFRVDCVLAVQDDQIRVELEAPAAVGTLAVVLRGAGITLTSEQLKPGQPSRMGRSYRLAGIQPGQKIVFTLSGTTKMTKPAASSPEAEKPASSARTVALVGAGVILAIALLIVFLKPKKGASSASAGAGGQGPKA
jgi:hypothetical protein